MTQNNPSAPAPVAEVLQNYQNIPEADRAKAQAFFDRGAAVAATGQYEYSVEMYLQGLTIDPENVEAHQSLRDISMKRKASGGKDLGFMEKMKMKSSRAKDEKQAMLTAEKLLAYDPGDVGNMVSLMVNAHKAGYYETVMWIGAIATRANADSSKPDFNKFITIRDC